MLLRHIYNEQLAQASYLIGCVATGDALVVDPNRDVERYIALAEREGLRISAVTETHIHADFVSGTRELAARTGARMYLSDAGPADWQYAFADPATTTLVHEGSRFMIGNVQIDVLHTPGHTPEHLSFLVTDTAGADEPIGILTGDFVFVGDVGRPDLLEKAASVAGSTDAAARNLFRSLQRFRELPDWLQVWPGHGAGSACGRALGGVPQSTVGYERRFGWAFAVADEAAFVAAVLEGQPDPPRYFAEMKRINKLGAAMVSDLPPVTALPTGDLAGALDGGTPVVDLRPVAVFAAGHVPGTLNLPLGSDFLTWAGWLLPYDRPIALLGDADAVREAVAQLRLIGLDRVAGYWTTTALDTWQQSGRALATIERVEPADARRLLADGDLAVLDVRTAAEHVAGTLPGAQHIPLSQLQARLSDVPAEKPVLVHCQSGLRSAIAASLLSPDHKVLDLVGGYATWRSAQDDRTVEDDFMAAVSA